MGILPHSSIHKKGEIELIKRVLNIERNNMFNKALKKSKINDFNNIEKLYIMCSYLVLFSVILFFGSGNTVLIAFCWVFVSLILFFWHRYNYSRFRLYFSVYCFLFFFVNLFIFLVFYLEKSNVYFMGIVILITLLLISYLAFLVCDFIFNIIVKKVFPNELEEEITFNNVKEKNLKEMSNFITYNNQVEYVMLTFTNLIVYFFVSLFGILLLLKHSEGINLPFFEPVANFITRNNSIITFINFISLFSLMLTIFGLTIPKQKKIFNDAQNQYKKKSLKDNTKTKCCNGKNTG